EVDRHVLARRGQFVRIWAAVAEIVAGAAAGPHRGLLPAGQVEQARIPRHAAGSGAVVQVRQFVQQRRQRGGFRFSGCRALPLLPVVQQYPPAQVAPLPGATMHAFGKVVAPFQRDRAIEGLGPGGRQPSLGGRDQFLRRGCVGGAESGGKPEARRGGDRGAGQQQGRQRREADHSAARIFRASSRSLAWRAAASRSRSTRRAASKRALRTWSSLATKPAASSRAAWTSLSSPEVLPEDAEVPAEEAPAEVPAKLEACDGRAKASRTAAAAGRTRCFMETGQDW